MTDQRAQEHQRAQEQTKLLFTLAQIAQLGDEAQRLAIEAMHAFDRYRLASTPKALPVDTSKGMFARRQIRRKVDW